MSSEALILFFIAGIVLVGGGMLASSLLAPRKTPLKLSPMNVALKPGDPPGLTSKWDTISLRSCFSYLMSKPFLSSPGPS